MTDIKNKAEDQPSNELDTLNSDQTKPDQPNKARRNALLGAATGASLVAWHKPIVSSMMLPAHAQTSEPPAEALSFSVQGFDASPILVKNSPSLLDALIPAANAGLMMQEREVFIYTINATETAPGSGSFEITLLERIENSSSPAFSVVESTFSGIVAAPGSGSLALLSAGCDGAPTGSLSVEIDEVSDGGLVLVVNSREFQVTMMPGSVTIDAPMCEAVATADSYFQEGAGRRLQGNLSTPKRSLLDYIIPEAVAGDDPSSSDFGILATKMGGFEFDVQMLNPRGDLIRTGTLNVDGTTGTLFTPVESPCQIEGTPADVPAQIVSVNETEMVINLTRNRGGSVNVTVPAGTGSLIESCLIMDT